MNYDDVRTIRTGLYSNKAHEILDSVFGQLSDGMWENSTVMDKYWRFANVRQAADGEIVIDVSNEHGKHDRGCHYHFTPNGFHDMTDEQIREFCAKKIKTIAKAELKADGLMDGWKRGNDTTTSSYLGCHENISITDIYFTYEWLLGRFIKSRYSDATIDAVRGKPRSSDETAKVKAYETAVADLEKSTSNEYARIDAEYKDALAKLDAKFAKRRAAVAKAYQKKIKCIRSAA